MSLTANASFKKLKRRLDEASRLEFQHVCFELLRFGWPNLQNAPVMGLHDRRGVDLLSFELDSPDGAPWDYDLAVQCKGVEDKSFGDRNFRAALKSIAKFQASGRTADEFWLVLNRPVKDQRWASHLDDGLAALKAAGAARSVRRLDPQSLLLLLLEELIGQARRRIEDKNREQLERYNEAMRQMTQYVADVPYRLSIRRGVGSRAKWISRVGRNACEALARSLREKDSKALPAPQLFRLVLGEFGFGKTLLLLELALTLGTRAKTVVYQPVVELARDAFSNEHAFVRRLYECQFGETLADHAEYPPLMAFREVLRSDSSTVLLLDGLDEHHRFYTLEGLGSVFGAIKKLACDIVMSVRQEFYHAYEGNFGEAMSGTGNDRQILCLEDWDERSMLDLLARYNATPGIELLRSHVTAGEYQRHYGDVPRRPLFLDMLANDLSEDPHCAHDLASLYRHYLKRKMSRDIGTPFQASEGAGRPLPFPDIDLTPLHAALIELQEIVASQSLEQVEGVRELGLRGKVSEAEVRSAAAEVGLGDVPIGHLLQHCVLMPTGRGPRDQLMLRFAHRSFQEFLAASSLVRAEGASALLRDPPLPPGVARFVNQILEVSDPEGL